MIDSILNWLNPVQEVEAPSSFPTLDSLPEDVYHYVLEEVFHLSDPDDQLAFFLVSRVWNERGHEARLHLRPKSFLPMALKRSFPNIESLDLSWINTIKNESLPCLSAFQNLTSLKLKRCREITDDGLEHLQELQNLTSLNLARCRLIGDQGLVLLSKKLTNLIKLNVKYCYGLTSEGFSEISNLRDLKELNCSGCCGLRSEALDFIGQITSLQVLKMNHNEFLISSDTNQILLQLPSLIHLQMKTLSQQISNSNEILTGLAESHPSLKRLDMNLELEVDETGFGELASLKELEALRISGKDLTSNGILNFIASLPNLKSLWISDSSLSAPLDLLTHLQTLTIKVEQESGPENHLRSISSLQRLRNLSLTGLTSLTGEIVSCLTSLVQLQLIQCPRLESTNLQGLSNLESLEILAIAHADRLDDAFCQNLGNLKKLRQLHLTECVLLTGAQFGFLSELSDFEILVIQFCNGLTDLVFKQINRLKSLRRLEITMCPALTEDGLAILGNGQLQRLEYLGFSGGQELRLNDAFFKAKLPRFKRYFRGSINVTIGHPI